ncbi:hypothetical protein C8J57DRAFT_1505134 [Mycena rebaudengoi]|nr:hypothetical protein C8J57DRAFT_1505134 [Mycena rebaudengoi]
MKTPPTTRSCFTSTGARSGNYRTTTRLCVALRPCGNMFAVGAGNIGSAPNPARLLAAIEITYSDGTWETVGTDPSWRAILAAPVHHTEPLTVECKDVQPDAVCCHIGFQAVKGTCLLSVLRTCATQERVAVGPRGKGCICLPISTPDGPAGQACPAMSSSDGGGAHRRMICRLQTNGNPECTPECVPGYEAYADDFLLFLTYNRQSNAVLPHLEQLVLVDREQHFSESSMLRMMESRWGTTPFAVGRIMTKRTVAHASTPALHRKVRERITEMVEAGLKFEYEN